VQLFVGLGQCGGDGRREQLLPRGAGATVGASGVVACEEVVGSRHSGGPSGVASHVAVREGPLLDPAASAIGIFGEASAM